MNFRFGSPAERERFEGGPATASAEPPPPPSAPQSELHELVSTQRVAGGCQPVSARVDDAESERWRAVEQQAMLRARKAEGASQRVAELTRWRETGQRAAAKDRDQRIRNMNGMPAAKGKIHRVDPDFGSTLTAFNRDSQSNC